MGFAALVFVRCAFSDGMGGYMGCILMPVHFRDVSNTRLEANCTGSVCMILRSLTGD